jgi:hypothetical protein
MTTVSLRYPAGSVTPHGAYYLMQGELATMKLRSWDDTSVFTLMGGENIPDYYSNPSNVFVKDVKGLVPPWKQIDQKGATQDGRTFVTSLYEPCEVELTCVVKGKTPSAVRKTRGDLIAAIDAINTSELSWFTHQLGYWWSPIRWMAAPSDPEGGARTLRQVVSLRLRAYDSFWRTFDVVDQFRIGHTDSPEDFSTDYGSDLGSGWVVGLDSAGTGGLTVSGGQVVPTLSGRGATARRVGWTGEKPVVELTLGSFPQWYLDSTTAFDFWVMPGSGTPGTDGIRARVTNHAITLTSFAGGTGTVLNTQPLQLPPKSGESWTFVGGPTFKVLRSGALVYSFKPSTTLPDYTSAGFGLFASGDVAAPGVRAVSFGTDAPASQSGFVQFVNWGDQPMPPRFTVQGPGTFSFGDGPGSTDFVSFGPILEGQTAQLLTDARKRGVYDLSITPTDPNVTENAILGAGLADFLTFVNDLGGLLQSFTGILGGSSTALPPQGNLYSLLQGRFSSASYIPQKPAGKAPQAWHVPVKIDGGTSSSQIIAAGTPLRRLPY